MNLKTATLIFISTFTTINIGYSQAPPGYLGKKTTIGVGFGIPTLQREKPDDESNFTADGETDNDVGLTPFFSLEIARVVNRYGTASLTYNRSSIGVELYFNTENSANPFFGDIEGFQNTTISSISLLYNWHVKRKGHIAPFGSSYTLGIRNNSIKPTNVSLNRLPSTTTLEDLNIESKLNINSLVVGWSYTLLVKDMIYLKSRLLFAANFKTVKVLRDEYSTVLFGQESYEDNIYERLIEHEAIQIEISAGILF